MEKEKNIDIEKEVETVGEILRNARLKSGKTIGDVADDLCIRKVYLTAIEEMDFNHIPEMPYGLGFIRSYAHYLGLNSDRIVASYKQVESAKNSNKFDDDDDAVIASKPSFRHILFGIIGLAILVAAWLFVSARREQEPVFETDKVAVVAEPEIIDDGNEKDEVVAEDEVNTEDTEAQNEDETADENAQSDEEPEEEKAAETAAETEKTAHQLRIELTGPSWLELKQGNKVLLSNVYKAGFTYEIQNVPETYITVGRFRNVKFYVDDKLTQVISAMNTKNVKLDKYMQDQE